MQYSIGKRREKTSLRSDLIHIDQENWVIYWVSNEWELNIKCSMKHNVFPCDVGSMVKTNCRNACPSNWSVVNQRNRLARNHFLSLVVCLFFTLCSKSHFCWAIRLIYACTQMIMFRLRPVVSNSVLNLIKLNDYNRMWRLNCEPKEKKRSEKKRNAWSQDARIEKNRQQKQMLQEESVPNVVAELENVLVRFGGNGWNVNNCWTLVLFYFG